MIKNIIKFGFAGLGIMLITCAVFGAAVMLLWNALLPQIFGFPQIDYLQAAGLLILARLLFGGLADSGRSHGRHRGAREKGHHFHHDSKLREKWMNMSEDERKKFIEKEKKFFKINRRFAHFRDFYGDEEGAETSTNAGAEKDERGE